VYRKKNAPALVVLWGEDQYRRICPLKEPLECTSRLHAPQYVVCVQNHSAAARKRALNRPLEEDSSPLVATSLEEALVCPLLREGESAIFFWEAEEVVLLIVAVSKKVASGDIVLHALPYLKSTRGSSICSIFLQLMRARTWFRILLLLLNLYSF
jgi:hypothetical protein